MKKLGLLQAFVDPAHRSPWARQPWSVLVDGVRWIGATDGSSMLLLLDEQPTDETAQIQRVQDDAARAMAAAAVALSPSGGTPFDPGHLATWALGKALHSGPGSDWGCWVGSTPVNLVRLAAAAMAISLVGGHGCGGYRRPILGGASLMLSGIGVRVAVAGLAEGNDEAPQYPGTTR